MKSTSGNPAAQALFAPCHPASRCSSSSMLPMNQCDFGEFPSSFKMLGAINMTAPTRMPTPRMDFSPRHSDTTPTTTRTPPMIWKVTLWVAVFRVFVNDIGVQFYPDAAYTRVSPSNTCASILERASYSVRYLLARKFSSALSSKYSMLSLSVPSSVWTERRRARAFSRERIAVFCASVIFSVLMRFN
jgi:hypothetical protein